MNYITKVSIWLFLISIFLPVFLSGQSTPTNFVFSTRAAGQSNYSINGYGADYNSGTNYNIFFGYSASGVPSNDRILNSFDIGSTTYQPVTLPNGETYKRVVVNRVVNSKVSDLDKQTLFFEKGSQSGTNAYFTPTYTNIQEAVNTRIVNRGGDNVFSNTGGQTLNNIERIDLIIDGGVFTPNNTLAGFLINERGGNDEFIVAAITSLNASGAVDGLGSIVKINISDWGNTGASVTTTVFQRGSTDAFMRPDQDLSAQNIHGVFISYADLGIANNTTIYGICIFPGDVNSSMDLIGLTDVPLNTTAASNDAGGLDLMGGGGYFASSSVIVTDIQVELSTNTPVPSDGDIIDIIARIDNNGPINDNNLSVNIEIPAGYTFVGIDAGFTGNASINGSTITWTFSSLNVGDFEELTFKVEALPTGPRTFEANVVGTITDVVPGNNNDELELLLDTEQSTLPVTWLYYKGQNTKDGNLIQWATAAELNNEEFKIERSSNGKEFHVIYSINGKGTSNQAYYYSYLDSDVYNANFYYRIAQRDFDGTLSYSKTIYIRSQNRATLHVFPNPVTSVINITNVSPNSIVQIYNSQGSLVKETNGKANYKISATNLKSGLYMIRILENNQENWRKIIVH
jgi:hypothetical protein